MGEVVNDGFELVKCSTLRQHEANPNRGNVAAIEQSIEENGFYGAVIADRATRRVLAGNHRLRAAVKAGLQEVPVIWVDADDEKALRILLADNELAKRATYDPEALLDLLREMDGAAGLEGTGYVRDDLAALEVLLATDQEKSASTSKDGDSRDGTEDEETVQIDVWGVIIDCRSEDEQVELLERLIPRDLQIRAVIGA